MSKTLALIVQEANIIEQKLIELQGEMNEEIEKALEINSEELQAKADSYFEVINRFAALETLYKERANYFQKISKSCANVQDRLRNNIKRSMEFLQTDEIVGQEIRFVTRNVKPSLIVTDEDAVPREYFKEKTEFVIDKEKLKQDLEIGPIPGAELKYSKSLNVYANTNYKKKIEGKTNE